jgi:hypothetical protein
MQTPDTAKPATAPHGEPASVIEQLGGQLDTTHTTTPIVSQADNALTPSLTDLAHRIRAEHEATAASLKRGAEHAMAAGQLLIAAKKQLKHGAWLPWLRDHCAMPERTARLYMRLSSNRELIESEIGNVADFSVRGAIAIISGPATAKYAGVVTEEWAEDCLGIDAFEQAEAHRNNRREVFSDVDVILKRLIATADVNSLGDQPKEKGVRKVARDVSKQAIALCRAIAAIDQLVCDVEPDDFWKALADSKTRRDMLGILDHVGWRIGSIENAYKKLAKRGGIYSADGDEGAA